MDLAGGSCSRIEQGGQAGSGGTCAQRTVVERSSPVRQDASPTSVAPALAFELHLSRRDYDEFKAAFGSPGGLHCWSDAAANN